MHTFPGSTEVIRSEGPSTLSVEAPVSASGSTSPARPQDAQKISQGGASEPPSLHVPGAQASSFSADDLWHRLLKCILKSGTLLVSFPGTVTSAADVLPESTSGLFRLVLRVDV